jgi:hypothetical protein
MQIFDKVPQESKNENPANKFYEGSGAIGLRRITKIYTVLAFVSLVGVVISLITTYFDTFIYFLGSLIACLISIPAIKGFATLIEAAHIYKKRNGENL